MLLNTLIFSLLAVNMTSDAFHPPWADPHMKNPEEIQKELEREQRESSPQRYLGDENQQEEYIEGRATVAGKEE